MDSYILKPFNPRPDPRPLTHYRCQQSHEEGTASGTYEAEGPKTWPKRLMQSFRFDHVLDDEAEGEAPAPNMLTRLKRATSKMWISGGGATSSKHIMLNNDHGWFKDGSKVSGLAVERNDM